MEWETAPVSALYDPLQQVEPEEDPLSGDISPQRVTVPSPDATVPSTSSSQTAPRGIQIVNVDDLLGKPIQQTVPCSRLQEAATKEEPLTTNILSCVPNSTIEPKIIKYESVEVNDEFEDIQMTNMPREPSIEEELSELLKFPSPNNSSQAAKPISLPGDFSSKISTPTVKSPASQAASQQTACSSVSLTPIVNPVKAVFPGNQVGPNAVLLLSSDGRLFASPIIPNVGAPSATSSQNLGCNSSKTNNRINHNQNLFAVTRTTSDGKSSTVTIQNPSKSSHHLKLRKVTSDGKSSTITIRNESKVPDPPKESNNTKPKQYIHMGKIIGANATKLLPAVATNSPLWPPPSWTKKKPKRKIDLPLSGSWTNPNPPWPSREVQNEAMVYTQRESDPLAGPVQDIRYPAANGKDDLSIGTYIKLDPYETPWKRSTATQCSLSMSHSICAEDDPPELKRPLLRPISRGVGVDLQSKLILYNVYKYFELRKHYYNLCYKVAEVTESATGIRSLTLQKIMREAKKFSDSNSSRDIPAFMPVTKRMSRGRIFTSNMHLDTFLRRLIHEHILKKKEFPSLRILKSKCQGLGVEAGKVGTNFIRRQMQTMGFVSVRTMRRLIYIEGSLTRAWRYNYLKQMRNFMVDRKNFVYTFAVNLRAVNRSSSEWEILDSIDEVKSQSRVLTVFHAADVNGFIDGAFFIDDTNVKPHDTIFQEKCYIEWLELHVLKKIPEGSVVVLAHRKYHEMTDCERKPNAGCSKNEVIEWLKSHVVGEVDETLPKCVLLEKIDKVSMKQRYTADSLVETYGHCALHLPPSQRDLNPIEYAWEGFRARVCTKGRLKTVKDSLAGELGLGESKLKSTWTLVRKREEAYRMIDPLLEDAQEAAIRKLGGLWSPPSDAPLPDETCDDLNMSSNCSNSDSSDSDSSEQSVNSTGQSSSGSTGSGSDSDSSEYDSEETDACESTSSDSQKSNHDVPFSVRDNGTKRLKIK